MESEQVSAQEDLQDIDGLPPLEEGDLGKLPPDPGLSEGLQKKVRKDEPPSDSIRFKEVYRNWRTEERERKKLEETINKQAKDIDLARREFKNLTDSATSKKETEQNQRDDQDIAGIKEKIRGLKMSKLEARRNMDTDREFLIDDQIDDLKDQLEIHRLEATRGKIVEETSKQTSQRTINSDVAQFVSETEWFDPGTPDAPNSKYDPVMAGAAKELEMYYSNQPDWRGKPLKVILAKVKETVEERFGKGKQKEFKNDIPFVEGIGKTPPPNRSGPIQLTEDQRRVARMFHPELEVNEAEKQYAQSIKIIQSRNR